RCALPHTYVDVKHELLSIILVNCCFLDLPGSRHNRCTCQTTGSTYMQRGRIMRPALRLLARQYCMADVPTRIEIDAGASTRVGSRRMHNEDSHYIDSNGHIFVVADGIGGSSAGEKASRMAVTFLQRRVRSALSLAEGSEEEVLEVIRAAVAETNAAIL